MALPDDFTITFSTGAARHTSGTTVYPGLDLHNWLQDRSDDVDGRTYDVPSELSGRRDTTKPAVIVLPNTGPDGTEFNIDDTAARFLNFCSIEQEGGDTLYTGLKSLGVAVAGSPIYVVQSSSKLTKYWPDGHIQILVKAKTGGTLIDSGNVTVFSRKYGQSFGHFDVNLAAGSEQVASITTAVDTSVTLSEAEAITVFGNITLTLGDTTQDLGNGNGPKLYKGTIDLNGESMADVYQALMAACSENSTQTVAGVPGWRYRKLDEAYSDNVPFPFGSFLGGKWFMAQGWWPVNYQAGDAEKFQAISDDGQLQAPPTQTGVTAGNLVAGDSVFITKGVVAGGAAIKNEYTLAAGNVSGSSTLTINETIDADKPSSGFHRIGEDRYGYSSYSGKVFTLTGTLSKTYDEGTPSYVPFIDDIATGSTLSMLALYVADRPLTGNVRRGTGAAIVSFPISATLGSSPQTINAVRTAEV